MTHHPIPADATLAWKTSSYSGGNNNCVEIAGLGPDGTAVRDSKDPEGPILAFGAEAWGAFVEGVRGGEFDPR